jgi:hypothetical protein
MCKSLGSALITILMLGLGSDSNRTLPCGSVRGFSIVIFHSGDKARHHFVQQLPGSTVESLNHTRNTLFLSCSFRLAPLEKYRLPVARADEGEFEANASLDSRWVVDLFEIQYSTP